ncbi:MAG: hypothetical protein JWL88_322 [Parcubacteria group bacterium]|nr:hypothetical protein [Parcubacteria group bacterium]
MKYFLDFDRTVFDTDAFKKSIERRPTVLELLRQGEAALKEFVSPGTQITRRRSFARTFGTFMSHGRFSFTPEQLREFLYPDVAPFLRTHDCTIVTYGVRAFITAKVTTALTDLPLTDIVYTSRKKGRTIRRLAEAANDSCTFVDDMVFQLDSVAEWCPEVEVIEIRRNGGSGAGRWRVIHSLDELN